MKGDKEMELMVESVVEKRFNNVQRELENKIRDRSAKLGVIGLGYVGLPLAVEMANAGFQVCGIDINQITVQSIRAGFSHIPDVHDETLLNLVKLGRLSATESLASIEELDALSICVPTLLRKTKDPDLSFVVAAVEGVRDHLRPEQLIILESTTYPGTTRDLVLPILEETGLKVGKDFFLAYSPERVDPGNKAFATRNIPKVIGGMTPRCSELATLLYQSFIETIVPVSSPETAEMVKLLENTFRSVNIALANEMALICQKIGINVWEVIDAAKTKPFGFMPFYPGPGLGGHCVPMDPYYLSWKAKVNGCDPRLIELAGHINSQMPVFVVHRIIDVLNDRRKSLNGSNVLALGITYKRDTNDIRESPAIEVMRDLRRKGVCMYYCDPHIPSIDLEGERIYSLELTANVLESMDCVVLLTDHSVFDYKTIAAHGPVIMDCRNAFKDFPRSNIVCL
jgi:UDP-N-acetyl-D-glucosamine dehydrogenase